MNEWDRPGNAVCAKERPAALTQEPQTVLKRRASWDQRLKTGKRYAQPEKGGHSLANATLSLANM